MGKFKLRPYQQDAVDAGVNFFNSKSKKNGIIVAPTGAGKSIIISEITSKIKGRTIIFQPSKELLAQNFGKYTNYGFNATVYSASFNEKRIGDVTFATIGSVVNNLKVFEGVFDNIIIDECHLVSPKDGSMYKRFLGVCKSKILGLTATPVRLKNYGDWGSKLVMLNRTRPKVFNDYIHITQIKDLVDNKFWSPIKYFQVDYDKSMLQINSTGANYTERSITLSNQANDIVSKTVDWAIKAKKVGRRHVICFMPSIAEAEAVSYKLPNSAVITSKTKKKDRAQVLKDFHSHKLDFVINVNVLAIGYDFPELDCIIDSYPTMSLARYYQRIGRGVRIHPNKDYCVVVDLAGNYESFGDIQSLEILENAYNYKGWGVFSNKKVLTGVDLSNIENEQKEMQKSIDKRTIDFGKHKGKTLEWLLRNDKGYLAWMKENFDFSDRTVHIIDFIKQNNI